MLNTGIVAETAIQFTEPVADFIEVSVAGVGDRVLHVLPAVSVGIDPAGRGRLYFVKYVIAVHRIAGTDHALADPRSSSYHLEGGSRRGPLLRRVVEHRLGRIALDHVHVTVFRKTVAVISGITHKSEHRSV